MSGVAHTRWVWLLGAYAVAGVAARLGLGVGPPHDTVAVQVLVPLVLLVVGAACLLLVRLPGHGVTRVLTLVAVATVTRQWLDVVQDRVDGPVADRVLDALTGIAWTGEVPGLALLVLLFPTGRPPGLRWRIVLRAQLAALGLLVVVAVVLDTTSPLTPFRRRPGGVGAAGHHRGCSVVAGAAVGSGRPRRASRDARVRPARGRVGGLLRDQRHGGGPGSAGPDGRRRVLTAVRRPAGRRGLRRAAAPALRHRRGRPARRGVGGVERRVARDLPWRRRTGPGAASTAVAGRCGPVALRQTR